jgi:hypothetical protein
MICSSLGRRLKMGSTTTNNYTFMGFFEVLTLIFVVMKILGYITWSWWWVFAPVIAHVAIGLAAIAVVLIIALAASVCDR